PAPVITNNPVLTIPVPVLAKCRPPLSCNPDPAGPNLWNFIADSVAYRVLPPSGPGPCPTDLGTTAYSVDENGYLYLPSPPWWNPLTNQANPTGTGTCQWMRFGPGQVNWTPDRPPGQPTQPAVPAQ